MKKSKKMPAGCYLQMIILGVFLVVAVLVSLSTWDSIQKGKASLVWPAAEGTITYSTLLVRRDTEGHTLYYPGLTYEYWVEGQMYVGNRVYIGPPDGNIRREAQEILDRYPLGATVTVYYDPADPASVVLEPGAAWPIKRRLIMSVVLGVGFLLALPLGPILYRRNINRTRA